MMIRHGAPTAAPANNDYGVNSRGGPVSGGGGGGAGGAGAMRWSSQYKEWETKVFTSTDSYASVAMLFITVFGLKHTSHQLELTRANLFASPIIVFLLLHLFAIRYHPHLYKSNRTRALVFLRLVAGGEREISTHHVFSHQLSTCTRSSTINSSV